MHPSVPSTAELAGEQLPQTLIRNQAHCERDHRLCVAIVLAWSSRGTSASHNDKVRPAKEKRLIATNDR